jgi:hypothetical protein
MPADRRVRFLGLYLGLAGLEGILAMIWLLTLPGSWLSLSRLALVVPGLLLSLALGGAALSSWRRPGWGQRWVTRLGEQARRDGIYGMALGLCALIFVICLNLLLVHWMNTDQYVQAYLARLAPYALWALLVSLQTAIAVGGLRSGTQPIALGGQRKTIAASMIALALLLILGAFIAVTRLGLAPDQVAWGDPGVPLFGWQIVLALAITLVSLWAGRALLSLAKRASGTIDRRVDFLICLVLWGAAVWRWGVEPLRPSYFSPDPLPPTNEFFPYSDAANYDLAAQSLLSGYGLGGDVVRPFYSSFLAVAHAASGPGYQGALLWQIPLLALLPPLLYLIARALHNRISGFFVGLLAIVHNSNTIALAGVANVSHAKLLMSDVPTALGIVAVTAVILLWLEKPEDRKAHPLIAGGILAIVMLVRVQTLALLPVALLVVWLGSIPRKHPWRDAALLVAGFVCVLLPWLVRNWQLSGKVMLSEASQVSQIGLIGQRYSLAVEKEKGARLPGESEDEYSARMMQGAVDFVRQNPGETVRFIIAHFLHNQVATFLVLPSSFPTVEYSTVMISGALSGQPPKAEALWGRCCSLRSYVKDSPYWNAWDGQVREESIAPMLFGLLAMAVGIGVTWRKGWLAAALPLALNLSYSLGNALVRNSGWRFNQPVDWTGYLFYGIGIVQLGLWGRAFFFGHSAPLERTGENSISLPGVQGKGLWAKVLLAGLVLVLLSAAIPISERAIPERYRELSVEGTLDRLEEGGVLASTGIDIQEVENFLDQERAEAWIGRALYPRFYLAGDGEPGSGWPSFTPRPYERLGFYLIGPERRHVVLRMPAAPADFPHAADVLVLGCMVEDYLEANLVVVLGSSQAILVRSPLEGWTCPGS